LLRREQEVPERSPKQEDEEMKDFEVAADYREILCNEQATVDEYINIKSFEQDLFSGSRKSSMSINNDLTPVLQPGQNISNNSVQSTNILMEPNQELGCTEKIEIQV
jgi:hypothetical protein